MPVTGAAPSPGERGGNVDFAALETCLEVGKVVVGHIFNSIQSVGDWLGWCSGISCEVSSRRALACLSFAT